MIPFLLMSFVSACASVGSVSSDFCTLDGPIFVSEQDVLTDKTVEAIVSHNERYEAICGKM